MPYSTYNPALVDLDAEHLNSVTPDGAFELGCLPQTMDEVLASAPARMGEYKAGLDPRDFPDLIKRRKFGLRRFVRRVFRQQVSDCVANAFTMACEIMRHFEHGFRSRVMFGPGFVYDHIGSSSRSGAYLGDGAKFVAGTGCMPQDTPTNLAEYGICSPVSGFRGKRHWSGKTYRPTTKLFKARQILTVRGWANMAAAILDDNALVMVGRDRHCVFLLDVMQSSNGRGFVLPYLNSWGQWGDPIIPSKSMRGIGYDSQSKADSYTGFVLLGMRPPAI